MSRGVLTKEVAAKAKELLKVKSFSVTELRLLPYVQFVMMNDQRIDIRKVNNKERHILQKWRERGWIDGGASGLQITKAFWDAMNEILWLSYVI